MSKKQPALIAPALALSSLLTAALAAAPPALAQSARVFPAERLEPGVDTEAIGNTAWAGVPDAWGWDAALWLNYEVNPLFTYENAPGESPFQRKEILVRNRATADIVLALALFDWLQLGFDAPVVMFQERDQGAAPETDRATPLASLGMGDMVVSPKVRVLRQPDGAPFDLAALMPVSLPTGQFADYFGSRSVTFTPMLAVSREWGPRVRTAVNVGHRFRDREDAIGLALGNEVIYRAGVSYRFEVFTERNTELGLSLAGAAATDGIVRGATLPATPADGSTPARNPIELLLDVQHALIGPVDVFFGGGAGFIAGYGVPDYRVFGGVRFSERPPADYDGDGIVGPADKCPRQAENKNGFEDEDGCPDGGDDDKDGIPNDTDKCKTDPEDKDGFEDEDGCPEDDDADGVKDADDQCRKIPEDTDGFEDKDGCPDPDNDKDGILDIDDKCKLDPEDMDGFEDLDGCPEPDNDKDTFLDKDDLCPNEAGLKQNKGCPDKDRDGDTVVDRLDNCPDEPGTVENGGCAKKQLVVITDAKLEIKDRIYFKTDKDVIEAKSFPLLDNIASVLKAHPEIALVRVEGHTDNVGTPAHNQDLSNRRAQSVRKYLIEKGGLDAARLNAVGFGQDQPVATNETDDGKAQNRRVEFMIVDGVSAPTPTP